MLGISNMQFCLGSWSPMASLLVALAVLLNPFGANAAPGVSTSDDTTLTQTVYLEYKELPTAGLRSGVATTKSGPFKKEPPTEGRKVERGSFKIAGDAENTISFLWDSKVGKLYLDLQHNGDLTDPSVCFTAPSGAGRHDERYQFFPNIHLTAMLGTNTIPVLADLTVHNYSSLSISIGIRSFWSGKVVFQDREYQIGVIDALSSTMNSASGRYLLLRPWEKRDLPFSVHDGSLEAFAFSPNLFFKHQTYRLNCAPAGNNRFKLDLLEQPSELQEVTIAGKFIGRLVLSERQTTPMTVVLDNPGPTAKIPGGTYKRHKVALKNQNTEAYMAAKDWEPSKPVTVANKAILGMGGPLTNSVTVKNRGRFLTFEYRLMGAGDQPYEMKSRNPSPPVFRVLRNEKEIASGKFEYG